MKFDEQSDEELVELSNIGAPEGFETLYYRYRDWVYHLAWRFTGNRDHALDVLQETFVYLLKKFPNFELTAQMTTFLYPAVKHTAVALKRTSRRHGAGDEALRDAAAPDERAETGAGEELAHVVRALPESQKEVLLMRFVDGMSLAEIGHMLDLPTGTVKSRIHRAVGALRHDGRTKRYFEQ